MPEIGIFLFFQLLTSHCVSNLLQKLIFATDLTPR